MAFSTPSSDANTAVAHRLASPLDAESFPQPSAWHAVSPLQFNTDWQGKNPDPQRQTELRILWSPDLLFLNFRARYRTIYIFPDAQPNGYRNHLWERDVVEAFLQPDPAFPNHYKEFEVSPNGFWIDLDIAPEKKHDLQSGLRRRVTLDESSKLWTADLAIPIKSISSTPVEPHTTWRANFYRVEGPAEPRFYSAWRPTNTPQPNFHVPAAFGTLLFAPDPS